MMIFKQIDDVLSGRKTQTRRICKVDLGGIVPPNVVVGDVVAVQPGRGQKGIARIRITGTRCECLQDISEQDAIAEGVDSVAAYRALWDSIYDGQPQKQWQVNPWVWVITFELDKEYMARPVNIPLF